MFGIRILFISGQIFAQRLVIEDIDAIEARLLFGFAGFSSNSIIPGSVSSVFMMPKRLASFNGTARTAIGRVRVVGFVVRQHLGIIHFVNVVAGQNQHIFRFHLIQEVDILRDRVGCAAV